MPGRHNTSARAVAVARRPSTNRCSDSVFRYLTASGLTGSARPSPHTARSALRFRVLRDANSPSTGLPPGRMNELSGAIGVHRVDLAFAPLALDGDYSQRASRLVLLRRPFSGSQIGAEIDRSFWCALDRSSRRFASSRASPIAASPRAVPIGTSTRSAFFARLLPSPIEVRLVRRRGVDAVMPHRGQRLPASLITTRAGPRDGCMMRRDCMNLLIRQARVARRVSRLNPMPRLPHPNHRQPREERQMSSIRPDIILRRAIHDKSQEITPIGRAKPHPGLA